MADGFVVLGVRYCTALFIRSVSRENVFPKDKALGNVAIFFEIKNTRQQLRKFFTKSPPGDLGLSTRDAR